MDNIQILSHNTINRVIAFCSGSSATLTTFFLHFSFSQWAFDTTIKTIEVGIVGVVGGAAGLIGKHLVERIIIKTKKPSK